MSEQLVVITASGPAPRRHIDLSIARGIDEQLVQEHFDDHLLETVRAASTDGRFYAWGAMPGPKNTDTWGELQIGAIVLIYQNGAYSFVSKVLAKDRNPEFARSLWGNDEEGRTWEFMYFLDRPRRTSVPAQRLKDFLPASYRGFTLIPQGRLERITSAYGSVKKFVEERVMSADSTETPPPERDGMQTRLEEILAQYGKARAAEVFGRAHPIWDVFDELSLELVNIPPVQSRPSLKVDWSVGTGHWSKVPWISILDERETTSTQRGVYCVLLFRQDLSGVYLTLNQGVTEPRLRVGARAAREELRERARQVRERFPVLAQAGFSVDDGIDLRADPGLGAEYESSTIAYKLYETGQVPPDATIASDLEALLDVYEGYVASSPSPSNAAEIHDPQALEPADPNLKSVAKEFATSLKHAHVDFGLRHEELVRSFIASLATKRFVILTGLSGSGKTQLALRFGEWLGPGRSHIEPVRPDWTGAEAVFGFEDALQEVRDGRRSWHVPRVLNFILKATADPLHPYLLILDEMNLAHVERYFADVLSGMESDAPVIPRLRLEDDGNWRAVPSTDGETYIGFPKNLLIVGTVNVDETTYMFSPKVLDRANVFEFRVQTEELSVSSRRPVACASGPESLVRGFLTVAGDDQWHLNNPSPDLADLTGRLKDVHRILSNGGLEFGHRLFYEATRFASILAASGEIDPMVALDLQIMQKILPRLHGARRRLEPTLCSLGRFCLDLFIEQDSGSTAARFDPTALPSSPPRLPRSFDKVRRMTISLRANQFVSFAE